MFFVNLPIIGAELDERPELHSGSVFCKGERPIAVVFIIQHWQLLMLQSTTFDSFTFDQFQ